MHAAYGHRLRLHHMARHGHGPFDPRAFWQGPWRGMGGRRGRARRGDVRAAVLLLLEEQPRNGYQLMEEIESRSQGAWRPSPGSIYPTLSQLEDEALILAEESGGRRSFQLTDAGRAYVEENRDSLGSPWDEAGADLPGDVGDLRTLIAQVAMASFQVVQSGDAKQADQAKQILGDARKALYRLLAD